MVRASTFLSDIEAFLKEAGMSASAFGWEVCKDPNLVSDLRNGRSPSLALAEKISAFMSNKRAVLIGAVARQ